MNVKMNEAEYTRLGALLLAAQDMYKILYGQPAAADTGTLRATQHQRAIFDAADVITALRDRRAGAAV